MIKRTLYFGNPAYLSVKNEQLVINIPQSGNETADTSIKTIPIEDIGVVVLDNPQITLTHYAIEKLLANNCALITCNSQHLPAGLLLPLEGNSVQSERFSDQIHASIPLKKQLWQQTVIAKIENQQRNLKQLHGNQAKELLFWAEKVNSGDTQNIEARAAAYYWKNIFPQLNGFTRDREGIFPNNLLNYGYAILRAIIARSLVASGLLPTLGIHHHNRYNAYCLADDIMEPYRPVVDRLVVETMSEIENCAFLTKEVKAKLLTIPVLDVVINGKRSPLMIAAGITAASLHRCYCGESRKISYPEPV
ncbi:MAG: type II CRISPR-associated endonuclease Cas1 [Bacteroidales bacterium]|mgnify:FL=1|nr:type II CRISPR-associated endonuclease Cas1 [Bacteroidales bacterium]HOY39617.1 type II CRISPR-associated endonuclease Cas1 [Bacteroidales bacterium]